MVKLYRSTTDKKIAGICGGLGELFNFDASVIRLVFVFIGLVTGIFPLAATYVIAWWIIPKGKPDVQVSDINDHGSNSK